MSEERKSIRDITRTLSALTGTESFVGEDDSGDFQALISTLQSYSIGYPLRIIPGTLVLSYSNTTTFGVSAGKVTDDTFIYGLNLSTAFTKTTGAWIVGTGNGALDTGSVANSTTYHVFLIRKDSDGSIDILISTSSTSPTMPSGYTYKRRIGCFRTNGSAQIINFYQIGNMFRFIAQQDDRPVAILPNTTRNLLTVSAPEGMIGIFSCLWVNSAAAAQAYGIVQAVDETDSVPSATNTTGYTYLINGSITPEQLIYIDSNRQIAYRGANANLYLRIGCLGWIDPLL